MNLQKALLHEHSKAQMNKIVSYVGYNPERFKALLDIFLKGPYRVTQRASWPLSYCVQNYPELIKPFLKPVLAFLKKPDIHDAVKRNTIRLLQYVDIPKRFYGNVADLCFSFLQDKKVPVAIKACCITVIGKLIENEPDLSNELKIILEDQLPYASPAFKIRATKFLNTLS